LFTIDVTLRSNQHSYPTLIDSGETRTFVSAELALPMDPLDASIELQLFNGQLTQSGPITHHHVDTIMLQNGISFPVDLLVTQLSRTTPIILGLLWLQEANSDVNWRSMMMTFNTGDERLAASISLKSKHNPSIKEVPDEDSPLLPDPLSLLGPMLEDLKGEGSAKDNTKTQHHPAPKTPNPTPMPPLDAQAQASTPLSLTDTDTDTGIIPPSNTNPDLSRLKTDENPDSPPSNTNPDLSHLKTNKNPHSPPSNINPDLSHSKTGKNSNIPPSNANSDLSRSKTSKSSNFPPSHTNYDLSCSKIPIPFPPNIPWNRYKSRPHPRSPSPHPYREEPPANSSSGGSPQVRIIGAAPFA
ncbi:hypothetical protein C0992_006860, partial [Termitomyces sp. T32_za158]